MGEGDKYRPSRYPLRNADYGREERYNSYYDRPQHGNSRDRERRYPRSPPRYRSRSPVDRYYDGKNDVFSFRGAANRDLNPPQTNFTFRPAPSAPRFPSRSPEPRQRSPRPQVRRPEHVNQGYSNHQAGGRRGGRQHGSRGRGRGGFAPRPAHTRDILHRAHRGSTPEQLAGMDSDRQVRFTAADTNSGMDTNDEDDDAVARKRVKTQPAAPDFKPATWSNPDPYTSLPPPATFGTSTKVDVLQLIRNSKTQIETTQNVNSANAVKNNVDFVSFNDAVQEDEASDADSIASIASPAAEPSMYYRSTVNGKHISNDVAAPAPTSKSSLPVLPMQHDGIGALPDPPEGLAIPTDEEVLAQLGANPKGRKRKRAEQSKDPGAVLPEWEPIGPNSTPWYTIDRSKSETSGRRRLHQEICDFFEFVRPYDREETVRQSLVNRVRNAIRQSSLSGAANVTVACFGSSSAGAYMYLPTADMDLVVMSDGYARYGRKTFCQNMTQMRKLGRYLTDVGVASAAHPVVTINARVPIIKFTDARTGLRVDISVENDSGLYGAKTLMAWKEKYPAMQYIVFVIKQLLAMRGMNEVFHGGLGSFSVVCLVVSMLEMMPAAQSGNMDEQHHYGDLLLDFLDLYGNKFNIVRTGIIMNPHGYYDKIRSPHPKQNANNLTIIDPNNPMNDLAGGSRNIVQILECFRHAHAALERRLEQIDNGKDIEGSILGRILGGNYSSYVDQRYKLARVHETLHDNDRPRFPSQPKSIPPWSRVPPPRAGWTSESQFTANNPPNGMPPGENRSVFPTPTNSAEYTHPYIPMSEYWRYKPARQPLMLEQERKTPKKGATAVTGNIHPDRLAGMRLHEKPDFTTQW